MAEGLTVGANDGDISVAFTEKVELRELVLACSTLVSSMSVVAFNDKVELTVSAVTCSTLSSCTCLLLSLAGVPSELTCVAKAKKRAREVANNFAAVKKDMRFMVVLLYG